MNSIERFVKESLEFAEVVPPPIRFSIGMDYDLNFRLQYLAKRLESNRAGLASDLLELAISEAEKALGLEPYNFETEYGKEVLKHCGGHFYQDETGYYRVTSSGERVKLVDSTDENEVDYSLGHGGTNNE